MASVKDKILALDTASAFEVLDIIVKKLGFEEHELDDAAEQAMDECLVSLASDRPVCLSMDEMVKLSLVAVCEDHESERRVGRLLEGDLPKKFIGVAEIVAVGCVAFVLRLKLRISYSAKNGVSLSVEHSPAKDSLIQRLIDLYAAALRRH